MIAILSLQYCTHPHTHVTMVTVVTISVFYERSWSLLLMWWLGCKQRWLCLKQNMTTPAVLYLTWSVVPLLASGYVKPTCGYVSEVTDCVCNEQHLQTDKVQLNCQYYCSTMLSFISTWISLSDTATCLEL